MAVNKKNGDIGYSNESIYLDKEAFNNFIRESITSCKKRSKKVYKTYFIKPTEIKAYYQEQLELYIKIMSKSLDKGEKETLIEQIESLYLKYAKNKLVKEIIHPAIAYQTKRSDAEFIDVPVPDAPIENWMAVHDLMDYGDIEETIYRNLFKEGCIRIEIKMPNKSGIIRDTGKAYYVEDPEPIKEIVPGDAFMNSIVNKYAGNENLDIERIPQTLIRQNCINISQAAWYKFNTALGTIKTY